MANYAMCPLNSKRKALNGQVSTQTQCDFPDVVKVDTFIQTLFLTVDSDPQAEEPWQRFNCNNAVRATSPDFLKSLALMFQDKPAGQYLVKVELAIALTTLDFETQQVPETDPDLEREADYSFYVSHATQEVGLDTAGQPEAAETTKLTWQMQNEESYETGDVQAPDVSVVTQTKGTEEPFDAEKHF